MNVFDELHQWTHYWGLWNGKMFAKHGPNLQDVGLLLFPIREQAEKWCMSVAKGLKWEPKEMTRDDLKTWANNIGGICLMDGDTAMVMKPQR